MPEQLRITEIFYSLQGETVSTGMPTLFIRLTGCPLRCDYCDTAYAFKGGQHMTFAEIIDEIEQYPCKTVTVTGGEPLAQKGVFNLINLLCDKDYAVSIETSGSIDIAAIDQRARTVMDLKTPSSGEQSKNLWQNLEHLKPQDEVKFVVANRIDYDWAKSVIEARELNKRCQLLVSPVHGELDAKTLAQWILDDGLQVRFQIQLHKLLWDDAQGR